jgi:hypothetical protein
VCVCVWCNSPQAAFIHHQLQWLGAQLSVGESFIMCQQQQQQQQCATQQRNAAGLARQ